MFSDSNRVGRMSQPTQKTLALHVLRSLALAQRAGRTPRLEAIADKLGVRRTDVRAVLTALHREGYLDVRTMRLTLAGFALGLSLAQRELPAVRAPKLARSAA